MAKAFGADPVHMNVALTSYLLALAVFIPASGWVADRYGARTVFRARDRGVHPRLRAVRPRRQPGVPGCFARPARRRWRDDGAGGAPRAAAHRGEAGTGGGDGVADRAGTARAGTGAAGRRFHRHLFLLALDLRHQHPDRYPRHRAGQPVRRGRARAAAWPVRRHRAAAVRHRACQPDVRFGDRRSRRRAAQHHRGDDRHRRWSPSSVTCCMPGSIRHRCSTCR